MEGQLMKHSSGFYLIFRSVVSGSEKYARFGVGCPTEYKIKVPISRLYANFYLPYMALHLTDICDDNFR